MLEMELTSLMIEKSMNKNQSVEQHSARILNLIESKTECENEIKRLTVELSENAWTIMKLGEIEMFGNIEEIVYKILDSVIVPEFNPENEKGNVKRKRSSESDDQEEFLSVFKSKKKLKVNTKKVQKTEKNKNKITTPKKEENIQNEKENTTPAPIYNFLNKFNFKQKKIENKKQENEIKIKKSEKEIFMSKFNQIKNVFEKEKDKKKTSNTKLKSNTSSRTKPNTKLKTNPEGNHHNNTNNGDPNRLEGKLVPPNAPTPRFSFRNRSRKDTTEKSGSTNYPRHDNHSTTATPSSSNSSTSRSNTRTTRSTTTTTKTRPNTKNHNRQQPPSKL